MKISTIQVLSQFNKEENLQSCFISMDDAISTPDEAMSIQENREESNQFYNNKEIIDCTGAGKDEIPSKEESINIRFSKNLPFLSENVREKLENHVISPHADTLDIDDLDDIESVRSEQSN